ncbi:hypothetical protein [Shewanella marisflavi]|uniref:hypothetical protein n=1 Tax=Shewanella marisflavi TaxID=260364 RepID=UPI003AABC807
MPNVRISIEEQLSDLRSDQVAYKVTIQNSGHTSIRLLAIHPRVPMGGELVEITDSSLEEASEQRAELLEELNKLLKQFLWVESDAFRQAWVQRQQEAFKDVMSFSGIAKVYYHMLKSGPKEWQSRMQREFDVFQYKIRSVTDAEESITRWISKADQSSAISSLFAAKTEQLGAIESAMNESDKSSLATIEPESEFISTYVLKFNRASFDPLKYQISFEASYTESESSKPKVTSVGTSVQISPYPWSLSCVAVLAALLGTLVNISLDSQGLKPDAILNLVASSAMSFVSSTVLALVIFNVYEHTSLAGNIRLPVSWRSALLIGALCGVAQENILNALKALVGA